MAGFSLGNAVSPGWSGYDFNNTGAGLTPDLLSAVNSANRTSVSGDGNYQLSYYGGAPSYTSNGGDDWNANYNNPEYWMNDLHQGPGSAVRVYDKSGKFLRNETGSGIISPIAGVAMVAGAGLGFGALGATTAGTAGAAAGTTGAEGAAGGGMGVGMGGTGSATGGVGYGGMGGGTAFGEAGGAAGSTYGGSSLAGTSFAGAGAGAGAGGGGTATGGTPPPTNPYSAQGIAQSLGGNVSPQQIAGLSQLFGGGGGGGQGGINLGGLAPLIGGVNDAYQANQGGQRMLDWMNGQQAKVDNLYAPNSPEYNYLWNEMSAKDAAAGRNSQYGPRSVDLAARIASIKGDQTARMTTGMAPAYARAIQDQVTARSLPGFNAALGNNSLGGLSSILNSMGYGSNATSPTNPYYYSPQDWSDVYQYPVDSVADWYM